MNSPQDCGDFDLEGTRVYAVSELAPAIALLKGDVEVQRFPVFRRAGVDVIAR